MNLDLSTLPTSALVTIGVLTAIQLAMQVISLVVLARTPRERLVFGRKWPWVLIIVLINLIGAVVFLAVGRRAAPVDDVQAPEPHGDSVARAVQSLYGDDRS